VSASVQVNGSWPAGRAAGQSTAAAANNSSANSSAYFPQQPVNFYTNSLYLATAPESPWTFYPQAFPLSTFQTLIICF
jgi:hypothetical protein